MQVTPRKQLRIRLVLIAALLLVAAVSLVGYGFRDGIAYFRLPTDVINETPRPGELFRLGGLVAEGSVVHGSGGVEFEVSDEHHSIKVAFAGILPDLFAEGQGVVALGRYQTGVFTATEVLAKHDETYMPKEVADALKEQGLFKPADGL
ncbi:MAG: cytochrome c maturation protein CcmE [Rhodobacteraceae bacterium]|nr:cytochrome c maturation protein CcmE [Paracoccaceae bacterium]MCY4197827.1 cytochrome c maturation protein CcmE [Paracoccaceae bacterium]